MIIRLEQPGDINDMREVNEKAFGWPQEANIVNRLRGNCDEVLSLVAVEKEKIALLSASGNMSDYVTIRDMFEVAKSFVSDLPWPRRRSAIQSNVCTINFFGWMLMLLQRRKGIPAMSHEL